MPTPRNAPVTPPSNGIGHHMQLLELAARLGVPTFVLVVGLVFLVPRIDRGIEIADRVDAKLQILAVTCAQFDDGSSRPR